MAEVVVAAVAGAAGTAISGAVASSLQGIVGAKLIGALVGAVASSAISSVLGGALGLRKTPKAPSFTAAAQDRQQMIRSPVATRAIVYGEAVVSGPIVFAASSGTNNTYLHIVVPLAHGESEAITDVWYGDELVGTLDGSGNVTSGRFAGWMRIKKHLGAADQLADADLNAESSEWTADHRLRGITYLYVRLKWDPDQKAYPNGLENIKARVKGRKVLDVRTSVTAWSANWALCMRDYLVSVDGLRAEAGEIDDDLIIAAANLSDELVTTPGAGTEPRYTCNGTVDTGNTPMANLRGLLTAGAGKLIYSTGAYLLYGGAYVTPTITLDEDDLRGAIAVRARTPRQDLFNRVRGTFVSPANYWQPADFPAISNATYETQDGGEQITTDIELPYTITSFAAQRIAKIILERGRQGITVEMPCKLTAFRLRAGDYVYLSIAQLGWSSKPFSVTAWRMQPDGGIDLSLREEAAATYAWSSGEATVVDPAPDTTLPSLSFVAPPTALVCYSGSSHQLSQPDGVTLCRLYCEWTHTTDSQATHYELQYRLDGTTEWTSAVVSASTRSAYIAPVQPGLDYQVRVRTVNLRGSLSAWEGPDLITASSDASTVSVDYADITGDKPAPGATADLALIATGSCVITGNTVTKTGPDGWDSSVYSVESYTNGAWVTFIPSQADKSAIIGLNTDPTTSSGYTDLDYALQGSASGGLNAWESNTQISLGSYVAGDVLSVQYDGDKVRYYKNGAVLRTVSAGAGKRFYLDGTFNQTGVTVTGLRFGPLSSPRQALEAETTVTSGGITFSAGGAIKGGQTAYNTGNGWFLGFSGGQYRFSIGDPNGNFLTWSGTALAVRGDFNYEYVDGTLLSYNSGVTLSSNSTSTWTKYKGFIMDRSGTVTVKFDLNSNIGGSTVRGQIYRNGSPYGTQRSTTSLSAVEFSESLPFDRGDRVDLYLQSPSGAAATNTYLRMYSANPSYPIAN